MKKRPTPIGRVRQLMPLQTKCGMLFHMGSKIVLDKKNTIAKKLHQIVWQQGSQYGTVGDCCDYIKHEELIQLAKDGFVRLYTPMGTAIVF